jgi:hypothetical protein
MAGCVFVVVGDGKWKEVQTSELADVYAERLVESDDK